MYPSYSSASSDNVIDTRLGQLYIPEEQYELFKLSLPDDEILKMSIRNLEKDREHWNKGPWNLEETDKENVKFFLGDQFDTTTYLQPNANDNYADNRLFDSVRAILSYATGQLAMPEITPSRSDASYLRMARSIQMALYEHSANEQADLKFRTALLSLLLRKRAFLKLRFNPNTGLYGDIVTDNCDASDITIDRESGYRDEPRRIFHRSRCTIESLCIDFPHKQKQIYSMYNFKKGTMLQMNRMVTKFECWYTYRDAKGVPREAVEWFIHDPEPLLLDNIPNPNWIYTGNDKKDKETNVMFAPPKPFIGFNFINLGMSYIDETTLFDQAKPLQKLLNIRQQQLRKNADYINGRWVGSRKAMEESDLKKLINKGPRTMTMVNAEDVGKAVQVLAPPVMPAWVVENVQDLRNEIDVIMGTPSIFKGANPQNSDTLGRDAMLKQQAGMLQDDLVRCVQYAYQDYYLKKLQCMRVYYTDDYWFQVKGGDGKFDFVMLNGETIDSNVRVGVQVDSTLPLDKASIRAHAMELAKMDRIDQLTLLEDLGLPDPEIRTERFLRSNIDLYTYMQSIETQLDHNDAEVDIMLVVADRIPEERDNYDESYLNYFNDFISKNSFTKLKPATQQRVLTFLNEVKQRAQRTAQLGETMLNQAGILNRPPIFPLPKRTMNIRLNGMMDPQTTGNMAQNEGQMFTPITGAEQAQSPATQAANQIQQAAPPNSGTGQM